jgi:hypothetical protein
MNCILFQEILSFIYLVQFILNVTIYCRLPVKVRAVFACSNTGVVGSNPTRGMKVRLRLLCFCAVLYVGSGLVTG